MSVWFDWARGLRRRWRVAAGSGDDGLLIVEKPPKRFPRRYGDFTVNICGRLSSAARSARYRLNDGPWREISHGLPRVPHPLFTVELRCDELRHGRNVLLLWADATTGDEQTVPLEFSYEPDPVELPVKQTWEGDLDVQDGPWERVRVDEGWHVRPRPGTELYDRIIVATGAFAGGREIQTELVFHRRRPDRPLFGFGVLPLWGGRPDSSGHSPREGWNFSLVWYYSKYEGIGIEFSYKDGATDPGWISSYRDFPLLPRVSYRLRVQCWPVVSAAGQHLAWVQRMRWWPASEPEPPQWLEASDIEGAPLPEGEWAVALIAHQCQVSFGPVEVRPFAGPTVSG